MFHSRDCLESIGQSNLQFPEPVWMDALQELQDCLNIKTEASMDNDCYQNDLEEEEAPFYFTKYASPSRSFKDLNIKLKLFTSEYLKILNNII